MIRALTLGEVAILAMMRIVARAGPRSAGGMGIDSSARFDRDSCRLRSGAEGERARGHEQES